MINVKKPYVHHHAKTMGHVSHQVYATVQKVGWAADVIKPSVINHATMVATVHHLVCALVVVTGQGLLAKLRISPVMILAFMGTAFW